MAQHSSSILSTHSGHHRIFIGPIVQHTSSTAVTDTGAAGTTFNISSSSRVSKKSKKTSSPYSSHHNHQHHQAPKPWWDQSPSFLKSHLSLPHTGTSPAECNPSTTTTNTTKAAAGVGVRAAVVGSSHIKPTKPKPLKQSNIPQVSYTFSDDSTTSSEEENDDGHGRSGDGDGDGDMDTTEDEQDGVFDSDEERKDYEQEDRDAEADQDNDDDGKRVKKGPRNRLTNTIRHDGAHQTSTVASHSTCSAESVSAQVGHSTSSSQQHHQDHHQQHPLEVGLQEEHDEQGYRSDKRNSKRTGKDSKGKQRAAEIEAMNNNNGNHHRVVTLPKGTQEKKRTKSLRDEGEPSRLKKFFGRGGRKRGKGGLEAGGRHDQGRVDEPDLGWESDGSRLSRPRITRQATSGVLTVGHHHVNTHQGHHTVLVSSPFSSELDLPATDNLHPLQGRFVSSPVASLFDAEGTIPHSHNNDTSRQKDSSDRPEPQPLQHLPATGEEGKKKKEEEDEEDDDRLRPGVWKPSSSINSLSSTSSPLNRKIQRGATWVTARESASSIAGRDEDEDEDDHGSNTGRGTRIILEEDEDEDEDDEDGEHYSLARIISRESGHGGGTQSKQDVALNGSSSSSTAAAAGRPANANGSVTATGRKSQETTKSDKAVKDLAVTDSLSSNTPSTKEPLSTTLSKAGTRFGRALLQRAPTGLKRQNDIPVVKGGEQQQPVAGSICSIDKDCQGSLLHQPGDIIPKKGTAANDPMTKKHVRFLTKVQYQISGGNSRQPTLLTTHPIVRQDRMLVRKEVTERPGPHVFNSDTARRLERQSQGWKEWWCVMKGPSSLGPSTDYQMKRDRIRKMSSKKGKDRVEKGRLEFYYNHKKINGTVILSSCTTVCVYSSLDYSIAVTQNYPEAVGLTSYILRPRTMSLACAWYMEIYTLLNGAAPVPRFIEMAVPDFDVKIRVPIPEDSSDSELSDTDPSDEGNGIGDRRGTALSPTLPHHSSGKALHHVEMLISESEACALESTPGNTLQSSSSTSSSSSSSPSTTVAAASSGTTDVETPLQSFKTALSSFRNERDSRVASKSLFLTNDDAKPTLVAPDEVTPKLLRSHVLSLLKDVPDWAEVVKMWQDPAQHGDVALCWKRYDRIEWIYWGGHENRVLAETDNMHLMKDHIGFADGSEWSGGMDETVVGPQVLDKTHVLELRPITHYPTKARIPGAPPGAVQELHEPDPIEGYLVRVSTFSGNPIRRFRRLYLTSHDHLLIYTIPSQSHSPSMQHSGGGGEGGGGVGGAGAGVPSIDPAALMFCITPHRSANPDHKDMASSRAVRRLKAQVRAARGYIDLTKVESVKVLTIREWERIRHVKYRQEKEHRKQREGDEEIMMTSKREQLGKVVKQVVEDAKEARQRSREMSSSWRKGKEVEQDGEQQKLPQPTQQQSQVVLREPDNYFYPTVPEQPGAGATVASAAAAAVDPDEGTSMQPPPTQLRIEAEKMNDEANKKEEKEEESGDKKLDLHASEPLNNSLGRKAASTQGPAAGNSGSNNAYKSSTFKEGFIKSATFVADLLLHNDAGLMDDSHLDEDSNVFEVEMQNGGPCVRFRAFNAEAARLWANQLEKLARYWRLRRHLDVKDHMLVTQANDQLASSLDDDEMELGGAHRSVGGSIGRGGSFGTGTETIKDWDNDRAMASPVIWNWCVVNGCRSITKAGMVYFKPRLHSTFRRMYLVLTEGYLMLFHPYRRSKSSGRLIPTTTSKLFAIHALTDIYIYSGHFADEDTVHGTNDESERLPRFFQDGLIADDPDEDCTFSIWRGKRRKMFSRRGNNADGGSSTMTSAGTAPNRMSARSLVGTSRVFGKNGWLSSLVKDGVVYGGAPQSCCVFRARSRPDLEEWVYAINIEIERCVRAERKKIRRGANGG
ncbi:hypothetical protein EDD11_007611 [Mortierella claussenii]|nr:hypothetical protein EDD11_007611 [Mortierella claussenii]